MVTSQQLSGVLSASQPVMDKTQRLVELANECGGHDNVTVVLLQYPIAINPEKNPAATIDGLKNTAALPRKNPGASNRQWRKAMLASALLLLILVAGAGWYFATPKKALEPVSIPVIATKATEQPLIRDTTPKAAVILQKTDTLRISSTQNFADLKKYADSSGKTIVLVPLKNNQNRFPAVAITVRSAKPGDTLLVSNLHLIGFENGIDIHLPISLKAENLVFENTSRPFRYLFKPGENQASLLFMNTMKQ
jgi:hypothetical protein